MVLTAVGSYAYRNEQGVYIVPISCNKNSMQLIELHAILLFLLSGFISLLLKQKAFIYRAFTCYGTNVVRMNMCYKLNIKLIFNVLY